MEGVRERTKALAAHDHELNAVPRESLLLHRIVWPLRAAKQSFILGNFLGCIALCGTISEMLAILRFEVSTHAQSTSGSQKRLYGNRFDRLGQSRRLDVLSEHELYEPEQVHLAREIKKIRDRYLHALDAPFETSEDDAVEIYGATVQLVDAMIAVRGSSPPGSVAPGSHLIQYLRDQGVLRLADSAASRDEDESHEPETAGEDESMEFREDWTQHVWDVRGIREQVDLLDAPHINVSYTGKYGLPARGPSAKALREALALVEASKIGQTIVDEDLVVTIEGLHERDSVRMLEGPGAGDPDQNSNLTPD